MMPKIQLNPFIIGFKLQDVIVIHILILKNNEHTCIDKHLRKMQFFILKLNLEFQLFLILQLHLYIF